MYSMQSGINFLFRRDIIPHTTTQGKDTGVGRQGGKVWGRKRKGQAGKKRQVWGDKEEKSGAGRERDRQGRRDISERQDYRDR